MALNNLNTYPYYDDFNEDKNFAKVLFVPGRAIQARELTQLQSILQEQIARHGRHMFKNGTMVLPGHIYYDNKTDFVKLAPKNSEGVLVDSFIGDLTGMQVKGVSSGVIAQIMYVVKATATTPSTLFVRYVSAGESTQKTKFDSNEAISVVGLTGTTMLVESSTTYSGKGSLCHISEGVYFINGYFVKVQAQTVVLDMYGTTPSKKVGLEYKESIVTEKDDETLYDNALGFSNYTAPGAHRLKIELTLTSKDFNFDDVLTETETDTELKFIDLLQVRDGIILFKANETKYAEFERLLARRTADESGDYIVQPFKATSNEFRSNIRGAWATGVAYLRGDVVTNAGKSYTARNDGVSGATVPSHVSGVKSDGSILWAKSSIVFNNGGVFTPTATQTLADNISNAEKLAITVSDGKAYVNGFEIKKDNKTIVTVPKARTSKFVNAAQILGPSGSYVVADISSVPNISILEALELRDVTGAAVGTCRVRNIRSVPAVGAPTRCNVYIFDVRMDAGKSFALHVKSLYSATLGTAPIVKKKLRLNGTANILTGSQTTINGLNTNFTVDLQVGAVIYANAGNTPTTHTVTAITNDVTATVGTNIAVINGITLDLEYIDLLGTTSNVTKLPHNAIKSLRDPNGGLSIDTAYIVSKYVTNISNGVYAATTGESFQQTGHILSGAGTYTVAGDGSSITFSGVTGTISGILVAKRKNETAKEKKKTLSTKTVYIFNTGVYDGSTTASTQITTSTKINQRVLSLTEADVIRLTSVTRSGDSNPAATAYQDANEVDITSTFTLNNGQTDDYYGIATITGEPVNRVLKVTFDYFEHSVGDYFSVDSYSDVRYEEIPTYRNSAGTIYKLSDCLDFRPRMSDDGSGFSGTGAIVGAPVADNEYIVFDYSYYLPRIDNIVLTQGGDIELVSGDPSDSPITKQTPSGQMALFNVIVPAYTTSSSSVGLTKLEHRRYTMQDIGKLESRLSNVEEYVALSIEEKDTASLKIVDQYGLDRFKNGFFVDGFADLALIDLDAVDVRSAIDPDMKELRPTFDVKTTRLMEKEGTSEAFRTSNNYTVRGGVATLNFAETPIISQTQASRGEFINPFNVVSFAGTTNLYPNSDVWVEVADVLDSTAANAARARIGSKWDTGAKVWSWSFWDRNWQQRTREEYDRQWTNRNDDDWWWGQGITARKTLFWQQATLTGVNTRTDFVRSVISQNVVTMVRGKKVIATVSGMKPFSTIESFINKQNLTASSTPCDLVIISAPTGKFSDFSNALTFSDRLSARTISGSWTDPTFRTPSVLNMHVISNGEVLSFRDTNGIEKATAVCVKSGKIRIGSNDTDMIRVVNFSGTTVGVVSVVGTTSGVSATFTSKTTPSNVTDSLGNYFCVIDIPHRKFQTGLLDFEFMDLSTYDRDNASCHSAATYSAVGNVQENQFVETITGFNTSYEWKIAYVDPLCQSFTLPPEAKDGAVITSIDIFFHTKKADETLPVTVILSEMDNGYPSSTIINGGTCVIEAADIVASSTAMIPTRATFSSPVYLKAGVEYGVKILSNSNSYKLWIARMGEVRVDLPTSVITTQPHLGSLFKSQNNSTWTAEQLDDLAFVLNRAKFDVSRSALVDVVNAANVASSLPVDPISIVNGSDVARISHPNHGFRVGDSVILAGTVGGYDGTYTITATRNGAYYVDIGAAQTITGNVGGATVVASSVIRFETMIVAAKVFTPNGSVINATYSGVNATGIDSTTNLVTINEPLQFTSSMYLLDAANEFSLIGGQKSARVKFGISSTSDYVSPMVYLDGMELTTVTNIIDNPSVSNNVASSADIETISAGSCTFEADDDSMLVSSNISLFVTGAYLYFTGLVTNTSLNSTPIRILRVDNSANKVYLDAAVADETVTPTIKQYVAFVDEVSPDRGSTASKYQCKQVRLDSTSTALRIMYAANIPNAAEVDLYYRTGVNDISKVVWTKVATSYKKSTTPSEFLDQEYTLDNLAGFNTYQIKLVLRSTNKASIPKIKNLRGIALA